tara:strand:+ start:273 stop:1127 length:855 start_codon:yes stop_codon:yes gene_type:complete
MELEKIFEGQNLHGVARDVQRIVKQGNSILLTVNDDTNENLNDVTRAVVDWNKIAGNYGLPEFSLFAFPEAKNMEAAYRVARAIDNEDLVARTPRSQGEFGGIMSPLGYWRKDAKANDAAYLLPKGRLSRKNIFVKGDDLTIVGPEEVKKASLIVHVQDAHLKGQSEQGPAVLARLDRQIREDFGDGLFEYIGFVGFWSDRGMGKTENIRNIVEQSALRSAENFLIGYMPKDDSVRDKRGNARIGLGLLRDVTLTVAGRMERAHISNLSNYKGSGPLAELYPKH